MSEVDDRDIVVSSRASYELILEYNYRLRDDRDTLIACLRECVGALEHISDFDEYQPDKCTVCKQCETTLTHAKSTLSKYER